MQHNDNLQVFGGTSKSHLNATKNGKNYSLAKPDICDWGGTRHPEGPLNSQGPPNLNFLLGFMPLHFENMEKKRFFVKIFQKKT